MASQATEQEAKIAKFQPGWRLLTAFASVIFVNLATALDATIIAVALPTITTDLHGTAIEAFWAGTSFLLTSTVWQPNFHAFSQLFGRRPLLLFAMALFCVGSIVCATSKNYTAMLAGRAIQGSGGGGILAMTEIIITDLIPLRERGKFLSLLASVWAFGTVIGPIIGGALAERDAWSWIFWLNLPILAISLVGIIAFLRLESRPQSFSEKIKEIDVLGSVVFLGSLTSFLIAISWGGVMFPWSSWHTLVPLIVGFVGLIAFGLWEGFGVKHALVPMTLFRTPSTTLAYISDFLHGIIVWAFAYYIPLFFEGAQNYTPVLAGVASLPHTLTIVPCAIIVGVVAGKTAHYRWAIWAGWTLATFGSGLLCLFEPWTSTPAWIFIMLVSGIGLGLLFPAMNLAIQASASQKNVAIAATLFTFFRCFGQSIGVAVGGVIFQNRMEANLAAYPDLSATASALSSDVVRLIATINAAPDSDPMKGVLRDAFADSMRAIWATMCGLAFVGLVSSLFIKHYDLNQDLQTEQGFDNQKKQTETESSSLGKPDGG